MVFSSPLVVQVRAQQVTFNDLPRVVSDMYGDRATTLFVLDATPGSFSICGTFDEIMSFASSIVLAMYQWPIKTGYEEWLGTPAGITKEGESVYVIKDITRTGRDHDGHCGDEASGDGRSDTNDRQGT